MRPETAALLAEIRNPQMPADDQRKATKRPGPIADLAAQLVLEQRLARDAMEEAEFAGDDDEMTHLRRLIQTNGRGLAVLEKLEVLYGELGNLYQHRVRMLHGTPGSEDNADLPPEGRLQTGLLGFLAGVPQPEAPRGPGTPDPST